MTSIARTSLNCRLLSHCAGAGAHELKERTRAPLQTNLIAYSSHATEVKEWFWYPNSWTANGAAMSDGKGYHAEGKQAGPITKDELRTYFFQGKVNLLMSCHICSMSKLRRERMRHSQVATVPLRSSNQMIMLSMVQINMKTRVWAAGMAEAQPIWALRELRWLTARRSGQLSCRKSPQVVNFRFILHCPHLPPLCPSLATWVAFASRPCPVSHHTDCTPVWSTPADP